LYFMLMAEKTMAQAATTPATQTASAPAFFTPGAVEMGGEIGFASQKAESSSSSVNTFSSNAYVGVMIASGFEIGFRPGVQYYKGGSNEETSVTLLLAPAFNINGGGSVFPYFELLVGYNLMPYYNYNIYGGGGSKQTISGPAVGVDGGFKVIVGNSGLILFKIEYLHQTFKIDEPVSYDTRYNTLSAGFGFRVFFGSTKSK
jgi:hypothetical protein